ncbi:MAG: four helix bundle protein [Armatimonadota bacterium]
MGTFRRFEEIEAWKTARVLTKQVYDLTRVGPFARDFGLCNQMQRAAVSIMSNIGEGFESLSTALFIKYLGYAKASAGELRSQTYVALDSEYLNKNQFSELLGLTEKCSGQISKLITYLQSHPGNCIKEELGTYYYEVTEEGELE